MNSGGGVECGRVLCCVLEGQKLGNLAVPERVHVRPFLLEGAPRRLYEAALEAQYDDRLVLRDELAGLEHFKLKIFPDQGEEFRDPFVPAASAGERYRRGALKGPLHVVG